MKIIVKTVITSLALLGPFGFQLHAGSGAHEDVETSREEDLLLTDLQDEILSLILSKQKDKDLANIECTSSKMRALSQDYLSRLPDSIKLPNKSWMRLKIALRNGFIGDLPAIEDLHSLLNSSKSLRNSFIKAIAMEANTIEGRSNLEFDEKKERYEALSSKIGQLGLSFELPLIPSEERTPIHQLTDLTLYLEIWGELWTQVWVQVGAQTTSQTWSNISAQGGIGVCHQMWNETRSQVGHQLWTQLGARSGIQVRKQVRSQVGDQIRGLVRSSLSDHFNLSEQNLCFDLLPAIDHALLIYQLSSFVIMHSPKIDKLRCNIHKYFEDNLRLEQIETIVKNLNIPHSHLPQIEAYLEPIRKTLASSFLAVE